MKDMTHMPLVRTLRERCRVCYACVRECPAKAIRIVENQAEVMPERCIGCGNCVRVCSQDAKGVYDSTVEVAQLLEGTAPVVAMVAPSFPAEFVDWDYQSLVGMLRAMGFRYVVEVGFGADLVARKYQQLLDTTDADKHYIATTCPAVVAYVELYYPDLVESLAPVVSPMVAMARVVKRRYGEDVKLVFIGPCIAKKEESSTTGEVDAVLTFMELRRMFRLYPISPEKVVPEEFDPPLARQGGLFPISKGLLQAAGIPENLATSEVVVADGRTSFVEALKEFYCGNWSPKLIEVLACKGCIMGAGVTNRDPLFRRRSRVSNYVLDRLTNCDAEQWHREMALYADVDLSRVYEMRDQRRPDPSDEELSAILYRMGKRTAEDELNCGACGYETCRDHAVAIYKGLAENEMCLPYTIDKLRETVQNLAISKDKLAHTQEILMQAEKLASMGQLAAGIAHELNNPLGVVLMFAHMLLEEYGQTPELKEDLELIAAQADRCKKIVSGLLQFARQNRAALQETDLRRVVENALKLLPIPEDIHIHIVHEIPDPMVEIDPDQITQVINNLVTNACHAMPQGGVLTLKTSGDADEARIAITDTGVGISKENQAKIFEPFFTTKAIGKGTGMGLAVTYGIVKMHQGNIQVISNNDPASGPTGTTFTVSLPRNGAPHGGPEALTPETISTTF